jgi:hypothetical protein
MRSAVLLRCLPDARPTREVDRSAATARRPLMFPARRDGPRWPLGIRADMTDLTS